MLSNIKMDYPDIVDAILGLKQDALAPEAVEQLQRYLPTSEERGVLEGYVSSGGNAELLGKADRFLLSIIPIPRLQSKLNALEFRMGFGDCREWVHKVLDGIQKACSEILSSGRLRRLLQAVLTIGNSLNEGTRKKSSGFKLASLLKLRDTKSVDGRTTLLHFLVAHVERHYSVSVLEVEEELSMAPFAAKFTFPMVDQEVGYISNGVNALAQELEACERQVASGSLGTDVRFIATLKSFHAEADACLEVLPTSPFLVAL